MQDLEKAIECILELSVCEVAINYDQFVQILPYHKMSANLISHILPSKSDFWSKIKKLGIKAT